MDPMHPDHDPFSHQKAVAKGAKVTITVVLVAFVVGLIFLVLAVGPIGMP